VAERRSLGGSGTRISAAEFLIHAQVNISLTGLSFLPLADPWLREHHGERSVLPERK
jgi:hypothetical protein